MDNTYGNDAVNVTEELDNISIEQIQETSEEPNDSPCDVVENEVVSDEIEQDAITTTEVQENESDEDTVETDSEKGQTKNKVKKMSGKKIAIVASIGVALVGAGLLVHKNTAKAAYYLAKSIM